MTPTPQPKPTETALPLGPIAVLNGVVLRLELAISPSEKALGLGVRESLPKDTGMLFVYGAEGGLTFWMKGVEFPIDILWLSREGTIVDISRDAAPEPGVSDGQLALYTPRSPAQYVLEINAGLSERFGFQPGDRFEFHGLPPNIQVGNGA